MGDERDECECEFEFERDNKDGRGSKIRIITRVGRNRKTGGQDMMEMTRAESGPTGDHPNRLLRTLDDGTA